MALFCIDIGNTNVVMGLYSGPELVAHWRVATDGHRMADEYGMLVLDLLERSGQPPAVIEGIIIASVVPPVTALFEKLAERYLGHKPMIVDAEVHTGVRILLDNPKEVGTDRVVNAVAAYEKWRSALIVVDFGTATTFDAVTPRGEYLGGAICPGVSISMEALFRAASKLPRVEFQRPPHVVGRNTVHSMQSGLVFGYVGLVDGLCARMAEELGTSPKVVATGGLASLIAGISTAITEVDDQLTLDGLRIIHERNR